MKFNKWTLGLAAVGAVSLTSAVTARADGAGNMNQWGAAQTGMSISGALSTTIAGALGPGGQKSDEAPTAGIPLQSNTRDGFNLDVIELNFEKPMGEGEYASGFLVQTIMGPNAVGYNPSANGDSSSDFGIKQAYVALRTPVGNGIDWKIGVFNTIIGFENFEPWLNPNYSRSWGWSLEPTQHTGILGTYRFNEMFTASAGLANTLSAGINSRNTNLGGDSYWDKTWMLSGTFTAPDSWGLFNGSTISAGIVRGFNSTTAESDQMNIYAGVVVPNALKDTTFGAAFDYLSIGDFADGEVFNLGAYVSHKWTEKLSTHGRFEYGWYTDDFDNEGCWYGTTFTLEYAIWANVISRLEFRNEIAPDEFNPGNAITGSSYTHECGQAVYLNFIYKFL